MLCSNGIVWSAVCYWNLNVLFRDRSFSVVRNEQHTLGLTTVFSGGTFGLEEKVS